jgi:leader peptidase (prepilin peptidase)/N-methyltransferase
MLIAYATCIAVLAGLAFGSFLNVCASRLPEGESIVSPPSHCLSCGRTLSWQENIPVASWIVLRGRCRSCGASIGVRYPMAELAVGVAWGVIAWQTLPLLIAPDAAPHSIFEAALTGIAKMVLCWMLILLATLDAENLWLPNTITLGGSVLGIAFVLVRFGLVSIEAPMPLPWDVQTASHSMVFVNEIVPWLVGLIVAPGIILVTRWVYFLLRKREGIGLGDAKLMLLLAVWLGLSHTLLAFFIGVMIGAFFAFVLLIFPKARRGSESWALSKMPLGTFLCFGGVVSALWGTPIVDAYLRAAGF